MTAAAQFNKRTYNLPTFFRHTGELLRHPGDLLRALTGRQVSRRFAERLMLAVTQVNRCKYCSYAHSRMALQAGLSEAELAQLLEGDLSAAPPEQQQALIFAQNFAASRERVAPEDWQRLQAVYGERAAGEILALLRMITMGNLLGNSFEALLWRLRGRG